MRVDMHTQYEAVCVCQVVEMSCWWLKPFSACAGSDECNTLGEGENFN